MARRENQGIQIAMIVFILTTLLFLVTTYFGYSSSTKYSAEAESLRQQLQTANSGLSSSASLVETMKQYTGVVGDDDSAIQASLKTAVEETYGQGLPPENQNFQDIAKLLTEKIQQQYGELAQARDTEKQLRSELAQVRATQEKLVAAAQQKEAAAVADANQQRTQFTASTSALQEQLAESGRQKDAAMAERLAAVARADEQVKQAQDELRGKEGQLIRLSEELNTIRQDSPDQYDGEVTGVVFATRTVWLNIGREDGVLPKFSFGVYDVDDTNVRSAKRKASIEVTKVLGAHRCEARITDTDYIDPVTRGDLIYSPIWSPGSKLGVALLGSMDVDKDGGDDRALIRNIIEMNGAHVDAEDVDGEVQGQITVNTRYLVVGEEDEDKKAANTARTPMLDAARQLGVEQMSLSELLEKMGYAGRARSVSYTGAINPSDVLLKPRDGSRQKRTFRERTPLRRRNQATSAY